MIIRFVIIGAVLGVAFTLFSIVDAAMSEPHRARGVSKPVWVFICVVLPVIGGILWLVVGKGPATPPVRQPAPDDDPGFGGLSRAEMDQRIADLENQLKALDEEIYPGEEPDDTESK